MELHDTQTLISRFVDIVLFDYPMELHDTQTEFVVGTSSYMFDYPMELHDTQTSVRLCRLVSRFDYPMELHDTQTTGGSTVRLYSLITLWNYTTLKRIIPEFIHKKV